MCLLLAHRMASSFLPSWNMASVWLADAKLKEGASAAALPKQRSASAQFCRPAAEKHNIIQLQGHLQQLAVSAEG